MDENRKKLYDQLSATYDMGTFDEFDTDLDNEDNQKVAWEAMGGQDGYGDFSMFQQAIARSPQAAEAGATGNTGATGSADAATMAAAAPMMETQQPAWTAQDSAMPGEEDADADISLPDAGKPTTPKDQPSEDEEIVNEPDAEKTVSAPAGDEQQERVDTVDYSTLSDDELMRNMGVLPGHELTQRDIDGRMTYIASIADPLVQQSEYEKLDKSIGEWNRRIERSTVAAREAAMVTSKKEESNAAAQLNENSKYISDEINATLKKDTDVDMSGTSEFTRAMMNDGLFKQFNDIIREIRSNIASWPDERLRQELTNRTFDNESDSMERAVYNVAIAKELEARSRGGHATTVGEDNFAEYIESLRAQDPQRARAIEAHADGYDIATRGHASSVQDHGDAALDDNPSYAVPRIAFELLKLRRAELSRRMDALKQGAPGGATTAAIEAMGYSEMLTAEDYEACFRHAEELFGRDKIEGYNAQIMRRHDETMGEAVARYEREVMSTFMDIVSDDMRPKNNWEYVFGYIVHNNFGSRVLQGLHGALHGAPKGLDFSTVYNSSVEQYTTANSDGAVNVAAQVFAPTATFLLGAGCIGEFFAPNIVGRWTSNFALRAVGGGTAAGMRSMAQKGIVKYGTSMLSTGTNFAAFGLQNELIHQLSTGDVEGVRLLVATLEEGLKGAAFGTATGIMGKLFERATGWKAYVGEAAKIGVEAAAFTGMGYLEARMNGKDGLTLADVGTNIGIVAGSKMSHFKQWSSEVRQRARNEGIYGRKVNYHEISEREREQLESLGYHGVAIALKGSRLSEDQARAIDAELSQMRNDKNVPWELVRCADWVLNGRMSVPPAVADARVDGDAVNGYVITAVDSTGRAIRGGVTVKGNDAKNAMVKFIKKEADVARYAAREQKMVEAQSARDQAMCAQQFCAMSDGKYTDVGVVLKIFGEALRKNDAKEKLGDVEEEVLTGVGVLLAKMDMSDIVGDRRKQTEQAYKVNLDKAIKKDASERTDAEKAAVKDYDAWLDTNKDLLNLESEQFAEWLRGAGTDGTSPWSSASGDTSAEARGWLTSWSDKIDTSDLVIVESIDQVADATVREAIKASEREGRKDVPGWSVGGKAYVYLPHIGDKADFDKTVMHELVAHRGLRGLLGENRFNDLCDRVWNSMSAADRARLWNYPSSELAKNERDRQRAVADEYIAQLSERTDAEGLHLWNKFVALLYEHLHVNIMGTGLDAQLREDIRESYRNLREGRDGGAADGTAEAERGGEGEPRKEDPIFEGEPEHIHEDKPDDGAVPPDDGAVPPDDGGTPPESVAAPPAAEGGETPAASGEPPVERPTAAVGRVEGTPADLEDWRELMTLDPDELDSSQVTEGLSLLEAEREQAHRYANGELADEPSNWEYWAARDGLSAPENPGGTPPIGGGGEPPVDGGATPPAGGEPPAGPERPALSEKPLNELTAEELDGEITRLMEYFDGGGQDADGSLDRRLSELYAEQSRREEEVKEPRGPQPPETPTPPAEPTGDTTAADTATERPAEVTGSADDQQMNDVLSAKLGEVDEEAERRAAQEADPYYMPMENKGGGRMSPNYRKATAEQIFNHLNDRENASGRDTLDGNIADGVKRAEDKLKAVERREPKGKGRSDAALDKWEKELSEARAQLEKWREVERMRQEQKAAEGDDSDPTWKQAYDAYTSSDEYPSSLEDYVARHLYGTKFKWKDKELERTGGRTHGLGGHLGLGKSEKERRGFFGWIDEKNGSYPESVAEGIHANMPDWMRDRYDTMEVLDAVLSVVGGNPRPRDMVVDYAKRLREQSRDMDEYYADEAAGARGFADAGEMDAYDNMREREATGFHDVAAAGREADGARADLLADARARLSDPNASEHEKQAARTVLRFRQRDGQSTLQGLDGYTEDEVLSMVREDIEEKLADAGVDGVRINGMAIHGSRKRGDARSDSDLDVVVEYDGDISEDGLFNLLNDVPLTIEGVAIDINPITEGKSGTLAQYMERSRRYDASKTADRDIRFRVRRAPNGEESRLDERQYDEVRTDNFKKWFGDWEGDPENASKVVDENGEPKVVLHGTPNKDFYAFDPEKAGSGTDAGWLGKGFYFYGNNPTYASQYAGKNGRVMEVYLDIKNPYIASYEEMSRLAEANDPELSRQFREELEAEGYDGVFYNGDLNEEWVAFYPTQIKSATENNGDFSRENGDIRFRLRDDEHRPTFYSNAERAVENVKQVKATAEQWKAMLTKAGGIKVGEDKWMGLTDWLDEHKGQSLTKDEVLQFVRDNGIEMREVNYGGDLDSNPRMQELQAEYRTIYDNLMAQRSAAYDELAAFNNRMVDKYGTEAWHALLDNADKAQHQQMVDDFNRKFGDGLDDAAMREMTDRYGDDFNLGFYGIMGNLRANYGFNGIPDDAAKHYLGDVTNPIDPTRLNYTTRGLENKREIAFVVPGIEPYQENDAVHFGPENKGRAVMWVRFGETRDKDGKRVLVIDEVQSNRHQDAREKGYRKSIEDYKKSGYRVERNSSNNGNLIYDKDGNFIELVFDNESPQGVPAAPFEKNWMEVAMKRMLRLAAEEGFDKVAWTTGAQQAERYGIGGVVESITKGKTRGENTLVSVQYKNGKHDSWVVAPDGKVVDGGITTGENLSDLIGKELSEKVMSLAENGSISGDGLRIGGEGMKGFYDQIVPSFMRKYVKKWGSQVGEVELATPGGEVMHSVDVTEPMKESVMQGQPLFRFRGEHETGDRVREKEEKGYRSLFDGMDDREEQSRPSIERERVGLKEQLAQSSDEELLRKIGESSAEDHTFYSEEYDRRHLKEYNEMCDNYRKMLDDGKVEFEQAEEMLLDAIHDWRKGHASAERTRLLAQFDTLNAYYAEKQEETWEREDAEHDGPVESATSPRGGEQAPLPTAPTPTFDPTAIGLRQLTDGETSYVQRRYERSGQFDFTGSERIESADDVAYIFRNLENSAIENVFLVLVKDGRGTILHVGMGDYRTSLGHLGAGYLAASELRPDKVVMVHNHPSGSLEPSGADLELHNKVVRMFGDDVVAPSIIIDTTRGEYSEFESMADLEIKSRKRSSVGEIPYDTYTFSRQVFAPGYNPATAFTVRSSEDVAKFVSSHRLGGRPKVSLIVLDNRNHVVGNVFLPYTELKAADASRVSDETARYVHQMGGSRAILYGRVGSVDGAAVKSIKSALIDRDVSLVDFIDVNRGSYNDRGMLNEEGARYNSDERLRVRDGRHGSAGIEGPRGEHEAAVEEARRRLESADASEFERTAARAVIKAYGGSDDAPDGGVRFRTRDDADMLVDMAKRNNEAARQRRDAVTDFVKAVTDVDELTDSKFATALGKVMRGQRQYDQATVADITTMVKAMMDAGLLTELDNFSVKQILTKVKDSTGKNDITAEANKLIDIMLKHQLRRGKRAFEQQLKVKGMRQDSRGVVVQGGLDYHGQRAAKALKEGLSLGDLQAVNDRIDEAEQRLSDPDEVVRGNAADELEGLYIARQYYDEIKQSEINEANIKSQLEQAQSDHKNGTLSDEAYKQLRQASNDALRELRCERVDAWARLNEQLSDRQSESAERAKQFREQQKQRQAEIQHWANSDMEGHSADPHEQETQKKSAGDKARDVAQAVLQPLGTFNKLMRYFGNAHPKGEGYLFGFVRRFMNVRDQWFKERKADFDQMDIAARRIGAAHGALVKVTVAGGKIATRPIKDWADVYTYINQQKPLTVSVKGKDYEITQGNAAYLLAMEGQADGRMKLRSMGLTEADMDALRGQVDPMLLELSDWVIHGLLPGMRPRLNATHLRMFGADMTDIPNYFPIRTSELARNETVNLAQQNGKIRPATITGSIIERKRNNLDLDLGADFFQVTAEHIDEMNHWNSFAEFARDLNTLLSYKRFKAQVHNLHSWRYGNGADIWKTLEDTAAITTGDYQPKTSKADTIINGATKGLAAANITFRPYTGLKQLLSAPVYLVQARWDDIGYSLANLKDTWQWAIKNLPTFAERWQGRMAGDPILTQAEQERGSQNKKLRWLSKAGFAFNAYVDAVTVAIGARAIYRTKYRRYKDMGYSEEQANQKALEDAAISVNETQQSGLGAFTSVIQQDRTFWSRALTIYRNASMGYQRQLVEGLKAMRNGVSAEWRATAREKVQKKLERDGIDSAMAAKVADRLANREAMRGLALAAMFGSIAPFVWALGMQYLGYKMAGGDDDEQEDKMLGQASTHLLSGWLEGIVFGGQISSAADFAYDYYHGRKKLRDYSLQRDLVSDMAEQILGKSSGKPADAVYDIVNMIVAMSTGVNPKSIVEPTVGIIDVVQNWGGDAKLAHEVALGWCRLLNVPQTSLDQVYIDEIGLSAKDAKQLSAEEFAERWCRYKRRRGAGWMSALTSDESDKEQEGKLLKRYERMMDERFENLSDERIEQIMESDDELLKKHAAKAYKSRIDALSDDEVAAAVVPLSDSAPQDSIAVKREGIKRAYKSEGMSYDTPSDREKNAQAYERRVDFFDIDEDKVLKGRRDALKKSVGDEFEKMGAEYKKGSRGWGWYIPDSAKSRADEIHAYKKAHEAELEEYGILLKWFGSSKGSSGYIKKGFTDGKHDADEVMKEYREARKEVLAKTKQR